MADVSEKVHFKTMGVAGVRIGTRISRVISEQGSSL
jgi:hypothetical protein